MQDQRQRERVDDSKRGWVRKMATAKERAREVSRGCKGGETVGGGTAAFPKGSEEKDGVGEWSMWYQRQLAVEKNICCQNMHTNVTFSILQYSIL